MYNRIWILYFDAGYVVIVDGALMRRMDRWISRMFDVQIAEYLDRSYSRNPWLLRAGYYVRVIAYYYNGYYVTCW